MKSRNNECVRALLNAKASPNAKDKGANSPLHIAAWCGDIELVRTLLSSNADVNAETKLSESLKYGDTGKEKTMASLKIMTKFGKTPLHEAARFGHTGCVLTLLLAGADSSKKDGSGKTPIDLAKAPAVKAVFVGFPGTASAAGHAAVVATGVTLVPADAEEKAVLLAKLIEIGQSAVDSRAALEFSLEGVSVKERKRALSRFDKAEKERSATVLAMQNEKPVVGYVLAGDNGFVFTETGNKKPSVIARTQNVMSYTSNAGTNSIGITFCVGTKSKEKSYTRKFLFGRREDFMLFRATLRRRLGLVEDEWEDASLGTDDSDDEPDEGLSLSDDKLGTAEAGVAKTSVDLAVPEGAEGVSQVRMEEETACIESDTTAVKKKPSAISDAVPGWMHSNDLSRDEVKSLLANEDGTFEDSVFIVQPHLSSSTDSVSYVISVVYRQKPTYHLATRDPKTGLFKINGKDVGSAVEISELVEELSAEPTPDGWPVPLLYSVDRRTGEYIDLTSGDGDGDYLDLEEEQDIARSEDGNGGGDYFTRTEGDGGLAGDANNAETGSIEDASTVATAAVDGGKILAGRNDVKENGVKDVLMGSPADPMPGALLPMQSNVNQKSDPDSTFEAHSGKKNSLGDVNDADVPPWLLSGNVFYPAHFFTCSSPAFLGFP